MSTIPTQPPHPPQDPDHQRMIDSFAVYVARNGPATEEITRQQQHDNPKFAFLFGGEAAAYYRYRLLFEIQNLQQTSAAGQQFMHTPQNKEPQPSSMHTNMSNRPPPPIGLNGQMQMNGKDMEEHRLEEQIRALRTHIVESESNLKAHEQALNAQKQAKVDALWTVKEDKRINDLIKQVGLNMAAFEKLLDRLNDSGSKETISNSKKWIFDNCNSDRLREIILTYLLHRFQITWKQIKVRERRSTDTFRLHVLYLINDWAHFCQRKKQDSIRQMLSRYVPKLYAHTAMSPNVTANNSYIEKLEKLVGVWEGHKYFDDGSYKQLHNPSATMAAEQTATAAEQHQLMGEVEKEILATLEGFTKQHKEYEQHILAKIAGLETKLQEHRERMENERQRMAAEREQAAEQQRRRSSRFDQQSMMPPQMGNQQSPHKIPSLFEAQPPIGLHGPPGQLLQGPTTPGTAFPPHPPQLTDLVPKAPYYELPAGMMVPLVRLEDVTYEPLREQDLRLPPPEPPSEQLMREIDRFYSALQLPPPVDCVRDADGWELNGLLEHYIRKTEQRVKVDTKMKEQGKTFEDAITNKYLAPPVDKDEKHRARSRSSSTSSTSSDGSGSSSSSDSGSKSSRSEHSERSNSPSSSAKRIRRSRSRSASPEARPGFGGFAVPRGPAPKSAAISFKVPPMPINRETNKGAQLMAKMGWEGKGLGAREQGIEEPVSGGEVRDKSEQFRGLGSKTDIYDEYRKQMSSQMGKRLNKF